MMWTRTLAAATLVLALCASNANAQTARIAGSWSNDDTGETIEITPNPVGGWRFHQSDIGDGRISIANHMGSDVYVSARGLSCYYTITLTDRGRRMHWKLVDGNSACLDRVFTTAE